MWSIQRQLNSHSNSYTTVTPTPIPTATPILLNSTPTVTSTPTLTDAQHLNPPHFHTNPIRNPNVSSNYPPATIPPVKTSTGDTTTFQTSGGSSNATYIWDFGDGTTETTQGNTTNHNYSQPGNYNVTVKVQDTYGERIIQTYTIAVEPKGTDYLEILKVVIPLLAAGMTASVTLYIYKQNKKSKHAG